MAKMSVLPNLIDGFYTIPTSYHVDINKLILKFIWKGKRSRIANIILKKNKVRELRLPNFKTYYISNNNQDNMISAKE